MKQHALQIFQAGIDAVDPGRAVHRSARLEEHLLRLGTRTVDLSAVNRIVVVGGGKAGAPMARALEQLLGQRISGGLVNVKYAHTLALERVQLQEAGHPLPDANGLAGAQAILDWVRPLGENDLVLCLLSGGGSALLPLPAPGLNLEDKQETTRLLLACGASIEEINAVRKHLSSLKGGQLARAAAPAMVLTLALSDVVGDRLDTIASGPTVPDETSFQDVGRIIEKYEFGDELPENVRRHIQNGLEGTVPETPKPGDPAFDKTESIVVGSNLIAIEAAAVRARELGYQPLILSSVMEGETAELARTHAAIARECLSSGNPICSPACILSGGETTVKLSGGGKGGRNQEFALAAGIDIAGLENVLILSAGTDGTDGPTDAAGAFADGRTVERALQKGLDPADFLTRHNSYHFFEALGDLLITGPTNTNVMDMRIILVR